LQQGEGDRVLLLLELLLELGDERVEFLYIEVEPAVGQVDTEAAVLDDLCRTGRTW
jgi:hypothetical protein